MIVVADTTPILYLIKINEIDILNLLFEEVCIHRGEAEAIALCKQINSNLLLIEDSAGIKLAKNEKIITIRIGTVLIELNKKGLKTKQEIIDILNKLHATKIRISKYIYDYIVNSLK